jgi:hypothetical protein
VDEKKSIYFRKADMILCFDLEQCQAKYSLRYINTRQHSRVRGFTNNHLLNY